MNPTHSVSIASVPVKKPGKLDVPRNGLQAAEDPCCIVAPPVVIKDFRTWLVEQAIKNNR